MEKVGFYWPVRASCQVSVSGSWKIGTYNAKPDRSQVAGKVLSHSSGLWFMQIEKISSETIFKLAPLEIIDEEK